VAQARCIAAKAGRSSPIRVKCGGLASPAMSAAPPIAGIRLIPNDRRLVPIPDLSRCSKMLPKRAKSLDHLVGKREQSWRKVKT
jgi:hypothetical protein